MVALLQRRADAHRQALRSSSFLTACWYEMYRPEATMYKPEDVIRLLNKAKVKFVVMGTHGIGGWRSEPRATHDIDILAAIKDYDKAVRVVQAAYPELEMEDWKVVVRFRDTATDKVVIDVMKPVDDLLRAVFRCSVAAGKSYRVPDLSMALVSKFAAMISPRRPLPKKLIDAGDFADIALHNREQIDRERVKRLAEKVYRGGGKEILKFIDDIFAGREIRV